MEDEEAEEEEEGEGRRNKNAFRLAILGKPLMQLIFFLLGRIKWLNKNSKRAKLFSKKILIWVATLKQIQKETKQKLF